MAAPVLLVHDDIATIAAVRRLLSREGYEVILATSAADALIAFGHYLPGLIILAPGVESGRGDVVLEELAQHPDRGLARVLLLGESIPGFGAPVVPLPLDGRFFLETLHSVMRAPTIDEWRVLDQRQQTTEVPALVPHQPEPWRATAPPEVERPALDGLFSDLPQLEDTNWELAAMSPEERDAEKMGTGYFSATDAPEASSAQSVHDEVAAHTRAAIEAELDAFEREVLAEATAIHEVYAPEPEDEQDGNAEGPDAGQADATQIVPAPVLETADSVPDAFAQDEAVEREAAELARRYAEEAARVDDDEAGRRAATVQARETDEAVLRDVDPANYRQTEEGAQREAEEAAQREAEEAAQREAEVAAQREAEEAAQREAEVAAQREAEEAAQREAEEAAQRESEEAAQREAEEAAQREAEEAAQREAEEAARREAEEAARREAEEAAQREAEEAAQREAEEGAQREAEEAAQREAEEAAQREAEEAAQREAEEAAQREAEEAAQAEEAARHEAEEAAQREAQLREELERMARVQRELEDRLAAESEVRARVESELHERLLHEERLRHEQEAALRAQLEAEARARQDAESRLAEREAALAEARQRESELIQREQEAAQLAEKLKHAANKVKHDTEARAESLRRESEAAIQALRQEVEKASDLARLEREERERLTARLADLQGMSDEAQARAESALRLAEEERLQLEAEQRARAEAEAAAVEAKAAAEEFAQRIVRPLEIPGAATVRFPPAGTVSLEELARMVAELARARAEVRLDLRVDDALRTLWLERGALVGVQSSLPHESILDRARRDGLIDARQESELRLLRGASQPEFLQRLRARGFLRDQEVVPLVQRHTESIALEALSELRSEYRLTIEPPSPDLPVAASPRPTLALVLEALRRSLDLEAHVAARGGLGALPVPKDEPGDLRSLGLSERELRLLALADGETAVEELLLASGLKQDSALRLLAAGEVLGWLEIRPAPPEEAPPTPELELARLDAKFREVQDADYFSILGLARSAGGEEIQRAFLQLSTEFDPLKFVGHPDPSVQHRARQIQDALSEAAQVLGDDRLRSNYARHLLD